MQGTLNLRDPSFPQFGPDGQLRSAQTKRNELKFGQHQICRIFSISDFGRTNPKASHRTNNSHGFGIRAWGQRRSGAIDLRAARQTAGETGELLIPPGCGFIKGRLSRSMTLTGVVITLEVSDVVVLAQTGLRFFTVYGPWGRPDMALFIFAKAILEGHPIKLFNNGRTRRDHTYIDDIIDAVVRLIDHPPTAMRTGRAKTRTLPPALRRGKSTTSATAIPNN
jgi:NAD dependent epimerase/dehydratase family